MRAHNWDIVFRVLLLSVSCCPHAAFGNPFFLQNNTGNIINYETDNQSHFSIPFDSPDHPNPYVILPSNANDNSNMLNIYNPSSNAKFDNTDSFPQNAEILDIKGYNYEIPVINNNILSSNIDNNNSKTGFKSSNIKVPAEEIDSIIYDLSNGGKVSDIVIETNNISITHTDSLLSNEDDMNTLDNKEAAFLYLNDDELKSLLENMTNFNELAQYNENFTYSNSPQSILDDQSNPMNDDIPLEYNNKSTVIPEITKTQNTQIIESTNKPNLLLTSLPNQEQSIPKQDESKKIILVSQNEHSNGKSLNSSKEINRDISHSSLSVDDTTRTAFSTNQHSSENMDSNVMVDSFFSEDFSEPFTVMYADQYSPIFPNDTYVISNEKNIILNDTVLQMIESNTYFEESFNNSGYINDNDMIREDEIDKSYNENYEIDYSKGDGSLKNMEIHDQDKNHSKELQNVEDNIGNDINDDNETNTEINTNIDDITYYSNDTSNLMESEIDEKSTDVITEDELESDMITEDELNDILESFKNYIVSNNTIDENKYKDEDIDDDDDDEEYDDIDGYAADDEDEYDSYEDEDDEDDDSDSDDDDSVDDNSTDSDSDDGDSNDDDTDDDVDNTSKDDEGNTDNSTERIVTKSKEIDINGNVFEDKSSKLFYIPDDVDNESSGTVNNNSKSYSINKSNIDPIVYAKMFESLMASDVITAEEKKIIKSLESVRRLMDSLQNPVSLEKIHHITKRQVSGEACGTFSRRRKRGISNLGKRLENGNAGYNQLYKQYKNVCDFMRMVIFEKK